MIKSDRKFGVEIEFISHNRSDYRKIHSQIPVVFDGSLRPFQYAGEWVSEPLTGKDGEAEVRRACDVLKKHRADIENPMTSFHIHLDGKRNEGELIESTTRDKDAEQVIGVSRAVLKTLKTGDVMDLLVPERSRLMYSVPVSNVPNKQTLDNTLYLSKGELSRHPRMNYKFFTFKKNDRTKWLRNVFYFYTMYSDVLQSMVSRSRRINNMYSIPLSESFTLEEIEGCETVDDIAEVWYKGRGSNGPYDDSRYHNVNLHAYFDRHGTVEIRSHGATVDPNKILLWVRLHQYIVDKLEDMELEDIKSTKDPFVSFLDFLSDDPMLQEYYKRLIGYFSNIIIQDDKVIKK